MQWMWRNYGVHRGGRRRITTPIILLICRLSPCQHLCQVARRAMRMTTKCLPQVQRQLRGTYCPCCLSGEAGQTFMSIAVCAILVIHFAKQPSELNNFSSLPNVCAVINSDVMRWAHSMYWWYVLYVNSMFWETCRGGKETNGVIQ